MSGVEEAVAARTRRQMASRSEGRGSYSGSEGEVDELPERRVSPSPSAMPGSQTGETAFERYLRLGKEMGLTGRELVEFTTGREEAEREERMRREEREERMRREEAEREERMRREEREERIRLQELCNEFEAARMRNDGERRDASSAEFQPMRLKMPPFEEGDDLETYLCQFERCARLQRWDSSTWGVRLGMLLKGKARDVCVGLSDEDAEDYSKLKVALLARFRLTAETYRRKLRASKREGGETFQQYVARARLYLTRWVELAGKTNTVEDLRDLVLMEQLINGVPLELATFIRERMPKSVEEAATLAQQYSEAREAARSYREPPTPHSQEEERGKKTSTAPPQDHARGKQLCFHCGGTSHIRKDCPRLKRETDTTSARVSTIQAVAADDRPGSVLSIQATDKVRNGCFRKTVRVNGQQAMALRDTGSDLCCMRSDLIPNPRLTGRSRKICYANSTSTLAPLAIVNLRSPYYQGKAEVALVPKLVEDVIIGNQLTTERGAELQVPVMEKTPSRRTPVRTSPLRRRDRRTESILEPLAVGMKELGEMQRADDSLQTIRRLADERRSPSRQGKGAVSFSWQKGLLWRQYVEANGAEHEQVVVPETLRGEVLRVAHSGASGEHLGSRKTRDKVWRQYYWPGMCRDIRRYCAACDGCRGRRA